MVHGMTPCGSNWEKDYRAGCQQGIEAYRELIEELRDRVRSLEDANRENVRIIAGLVQRMPQLEAPPEAPAPSPTASEASQTGAESEQAPGGADVQKPSEGHREPRYKRWFG